MTDEDIYIISLKSKENLQINLNIATIIDFEYTIEVNSVLFKNQ